MKGIILTGGAGTRLHPATKTINKGLLPIYDKPMIYYPLSTLLLSGISEILIISTPRDIHRFKELLGNGDDFGIKLSYDIQSEPKGIADCFMIGEDFIGDDNVCLILGDNIFYANHLGSLLRSTVKEVDKNNNAVIFGYKVKDPQRFGVVDFDENFNALSIEEKPSKPKSSYAVVGLYYYPNEVIEISKHISPSSRGELEITTVNQEFLNLNKLKVNLLGRGTTWLDTGTHDTLVEASMFIRMIEQRQALKIACIEEIAYRMGYINSNGIEKLAKRYNNEYGQYMLKSIKD